MGARGQQRLERLTQHGAQGTGHLGVVVSHLSRDLRFWVWVVHAALNQATQKSTATLFVEAWRAVLYRQEAPVTCPLQLQDSSRNSVIPKKGLCGISNSQQVSVNLTGRTHHAAATPSTLPLPALSARALPSHLCRHRRHHHLRHHHRRTKGGCRCTSPTAEASASVSCGSERSCQATLLFVWAVVGKFRLMGIYKWGHQTEGR